MKDSNQLKNLLQSFSSGYPDKPEIMAEQGQLNDK